MAIPGQMPQNTWILKILTAFLVVDLLPCQKIDGSNSLLTKRPCNFKFHWSDYDLNTAQVIEKYGLPRESHEVLTEDGYILEMFRIPAPGKPVVFLNHGIAATSRCFLINCDRRALAVKLADAGYDVWLANYRGNIYSRNHTQWTVYDREYWDFSIDELAMYDAAAMIDLILKRTGREKLSWIGHSMGNFYMTGLFLLRPEYQEKIDLGISMAGSIRLAGSRHLLLRLLHPFQQSVQKTMYAMTRMNLRVSKSFSDTLRNFCFNSRSIRKFGFCSYSHFAIDGRDPQQLLPKVLTVFMGEFPAIHSPKILSQWLQWISSDRVARYNYGVDKNRRVYGASQSPEFHYGSLNTSTIVMFYGDNDLFINPQGAIESARIIPKAVAERVDWPKWTHMDFVVAQDADLLVYDKILHYLQSVYPAT